MKRLDQEIPIYLYCYKGVRSRRASQILKELNFKIIYDFTGGWKAWKKNQKTNKF